MEITLDGQEIHHAAWFDWRAILALWKGAGSQDRTKIKTLKVDMATVAPDCNVPEKNEVAANLMKWLDSYDR